MVFIILKKESNFFPSVTGSGEYFHAIAEYLFVFKMFEDMKYFVKFVVL